MSPHQGPVTVPAAGRGRFPGLGEMHPGAGLEGAVLGILGAGPPRTLNRKQPREAGRKERRLQSGRCESALNVRPATA